MAQEFTLEVRDGYLWLTCAYGTFQFNGEHALTLRRFLNDNHRALRPSKDWKNCPYEGHHDSCDCRGEGGDR